MKRAVKWTLGLVFENIGWKLMAVAIAVALWALVASEPELATFATVRLGYRNLSEDLEISSEPVSTITLELRGPAGELRGIGETIRPAVVLNMAGVQTGVRTFTIGNDNVTLARGVRLERAIPSEVRLEFERRAYRSIPVVPRFSSANSGSYALERYQVEPKELQILGPASHVAKVHSAITDPVDVGTVVGESEFRVNAFVDDPYVRFLSPPQVVVAVKMKKK